MVVANNPAKFWTDIYWSNSIVVGEVIALWHRFMCIDLEGRVGVRARILS
jgi:hypothetical protein